MRKISTCEILNEIDKKYFRLYVEWLDLSHFKVILFEPSMPPLIGEMNINDINYFCDELSKSTDEYLQEVESILCGKDKDIQFFIQNTALEWKKKIWTRGKIKLRSDLNVDIISKHFQRSLKFYQSVQEKLTLSEKENENLIDIKNKLCSDIEQMIKVKTNIEQNLYKRFVLILNSKKKKIRELENAIKTKQGAKDSIFDVRTDESAESDTEDSKINKDTIYTKDQKEKTINNRNAKVKKSNSLGNTDCIVDDEISHITSTSKNLTTKKNENTNEQQTCVFGTRTSRNWSFIENDSEEELFSQE
ncbi:DNA repair protein XRCC4-like isoform X1 [Colletes gigas]|uniref:DNA repair protein XRCC4-like isoform X1 n=2 Tax=Colletes gigas TaxID=935657 RepID=UPI001C9B7689|nr:DNA repair protein XRCC4-like isoform X1 [Colletes gigas]